MTVDIIAGLVALPMALGYDALKGFFMVYTIFACRKYLGITGWRIGL